MNRFIKALILTIIEFVILLVVVVSVVGFVMYFSIIGGFFILILACFLLSLYYNYKDYK